MVGGVGSSGHQYGVGHGCAGVGYRSTGIRWSPKTEWVAPQAGLQMHQAKGVEWLIEAGARRYFQPSGLPFEPFAEGGLNLPLLEPVGPGVRLGGGASYAVKDDIRIEGGLSHSVGLGDAVSVTFVSVGAAFRL